ncbi:MAG: GNAT family N-acetyltransferase [Clostridia bacterium]|nr:GNAT family N-acetyltransferase [Clostridia bacterium]
MGMTTRKAGLNDLEAMLKIEASAIPGYGYLYENRHFYFDGVENRGEMVLAELDGVPVGMGQYSVLPDGSGWLEILRVDKPHQRMGAGRAIYRRYLQLAEETGAPSVAMFTGWKNAASRGLAEANGFHLAAAMAGYDKELSAGEVDEAVLNRFRVVSSPEEARRRIDPKGWGPFMALNRTFFHYNDALAEYLCGRGMVYTDGENTVVVGCRMLKQRGYHIGWFGGDPEICLALAEAVTRREGLPKLTIMFPPERKDLAEIVAKDGYAASGELIVMERVFAN